jgi:hypothetical protein
MEAVHAHYVAHPFARRAHEQLVIAIVKKVFSSTPIDAQIDSWANRHNIARGDSQPIQRVFQLGAAWYGHHLDEDWHKWTLDEARAIFAKCCLSGPIWELPHSSERF